MKHIFVAFCLLSLSMVLISCFSTINVPIQNNHSNELRWGDTPHRLAFMMSKVLGKAVAPGRSDVNLIYRVKVSETVDALCIYTFKKNKLRTAGYMLLRSSSKSLEYTLFGDKIPMPDPNDPRTLILRNSDNILTLVDRQFYDEHNAKYKQLQHRNTGLTFYEQFIFGHISENTFLSAYLRREY